MDWKFRLLFCGGRQAAVVKHVACCFAVVFVAQTCCAAELRSGDYLEAGFIEALRLTRSPFRALSEPAHLPQSITVERTSAGLRLTGNDNWHEGYEIGVLTDHGRRFLHGAENLNFPEPKIESESRFQFSDGRRGLAGFMWHTYVWVGDADAAVARMTLVGRYQDPSGHVVEFGANGELHGFGDARRFRLDNDHVFNRFDYFFYDGKQSENATIAFRNRGQTLILCALLPNAGDSPSIGTPDCAHPKLILKRF